MLRSTLALAACLCCALLAPTAQADKQSTFHYQGSSWTYDATHTYPTVTMVGGGEGKQGKCTNTELVGQGNFVSRITVWRKSKNKRRLAGEADSDAPALRGLSRSADGALKGVEIGWGLPGQEPLATCLAGSREGDSYTFEFQKDEGVRMMKMKGLGGVDHIQWVTDLDRAGGFGDNSHPDPDQEIDMGGGFITGVLFTKKDPRDACCGNGDTGLVSLAFLVLDKADTVQYKNWKYLDWDKLPAGVRDVADGGKVWLSDNLNSTTPFKMNVQLQTTEGFSYTLNSVSASTSKSSWKVAVEGGFKIPVLSSKVRGQNTVKWESVKQESFAWTVNKVRTETISVEFTCPAHKYCRQTFFNYKGNAQLKWVADTEVRFAHGSSADAIRGSAAGTYEGLSYSVMDSSREELDHVPADHDDKKYKSVNLMALDAEEVVVL